MLGIGLTLGMLLAVSRRRPDRVHLDKNFIPKAAPYGDTETWRA